MGSVGNNYTRREKSGESQIENEKGRWPIYKFWGSNHLIGKPFRWKPNKHEYLVQSPKNEAQVKTIKKEPT